jgi:hypothetical protein
MSQHRDSSAVSETAPLFMIEEILANPTVPYCDSVTTLKRIVGRHGSLEIPVGLLTKLIKPCYLMRESASCVADTLSRALPVVLGADDREDHVIHALLAAYTGYEVGTCR